MKGVGPDLCLVVVPLRGQKWTAVELLCDTAAASHLRVAIASERPVPPSLMKRPNVEAVSLRPALWMPRARSTAPSASSASSGDEAPTTARAGSRAEASGADSAGATSLRRARRAFRRTRRKWRKAASRWRRRRAQRRLRRDRRLARHRWFQRRHQVRLAKAVLASPKVLAWADDSLVLIAAGSHASLAVWQLAERFPAPAAVVGTDAARRVLKQPELMHLVTRPARSLD